MTSDEIKELIEKNLPLAPDNVTEWIYSEVVEQAFLLYKGNKAVCTRCGTENEIEPGSFSGSHGMETWCPCCDTKVKCLEGGRGRRKYLETFRILIYVSEGKTVWASHWYIDADFSPFGRPQLRRSLAAVYRLDAEHQDYFKKSYNYYSEKEYWETVKEVRIPNVPRGAWFEWYSQPKYDRLLVYPYNLSEVFRNTDCRYLTTGEQLKHIDGPREFHRYLALGLKYRSIELLMKSGFDNLALSKIRGHASGAIYIRGQNLNKILRLPDRWIKKLRPRNPSNGELAVFQNLTEKEKEVITEPLLKDITQHYVSGNYSDTPAIKVINYRSQIENYAPFVKWLKYITAQNIKPSKYGAHIHGDYMDYIKTAEKLGMDISKNKILYPPNLKAAHDSVMDSYKAAKDEIRDKAITMNARKMNFQNDSLMIIPALTQEDLNQESAKLCHCVKTYGEKLEKGICWIFFIRHTDTPNEPYYTLEADINGKLVQCRGLHNCSMTDEVKDFTDSFIKTLKAEVMKERREKGFLCQTA